MATNNNIITSNFPTIAQADANGNITGLVVGNVSGGNVSGNISGNISGNVTGNIGAAGANTQLQYNNNGLLGASANLIYVEVGGLSQLTLNSKLILSAQGSTQNISTVGDLTLQPTGGNLDITTNSNVNFTSANNVNFTSTNNVNFTGVSNVNLPTVANVNLPGGNTGQFLKTTGNGVVSWSDLGGNGVPGGANGQVQYNNSGLFDGTANLTFNGTTLTAANISVASGTANLSALGVSNVANLKIAGGSNTQVLTTNGAGNVAWANSYINYDGFSNTGAVTYSSSSIGNSAVNLTGHVASQFPNGTIVTFAGVDSTAFYTVISTVENQPYVSGAVTSDQGVQTNRLYTVGDTSTILPGNQNIQIQGKAGTFGIGLPTVQGGGTETYYPYTTGAVTGVVAGRAITVLPPFQTQVNLNNPLLNNIPAAQFVSIPQPVGRFDSLIAGSGLVSTLTNENILTLSLPPSVLGATAAYSYAGSIAAAASTVWPGNTFVSGLAYNSSALQLTNGTRAAGYWAYTGGATAMFNVSFFMLYTGPSPDQVLVYLIKTSAGVGYATIAVDTPSTSPGGAAGSLSSTVPLNNGDEIVVIIQNTGGTMTITQSEITFTRLI